MVALHQDDDRPAPLPPRPRLRILSRRELGVREPRDAGVEVLPRARSRTLVDEMDYRDTGCDLAPSCLSCPFERCKYDEPRKAHQLSVARRNREIVLLRTKYRAPIPELIRTYGLSRRTIFRVLREAGGGRQTEQKGG